MISFRAWTCEFATAGVISVVSENLYLNGQLVLVTNPGQVLFGSFGHAVVDRMLRSLFESPFQTSAGIGELLGSTPLLPQAERRATFGSLGEVWPGNTTPSMIGAPPSPPQSVGKSVPGQTT